MTDTLLFLDEDDKGRIALFRTSQFDEWTHVPGNFYLLKLFVRYSYYYNVYGKGFARFKPGESASRAGPSECIQKADNLTE